MLHKSHVRCCQGGSTAKPGRWEELAALNMPPNLRQGWCCLPCAMCAKERDLMHSWARTTGVWQQQGHGLPSDRAASCICILTYIIIADAPTAAATVAAAAAAVVCLPWSKHRH